MGVPFRVKIPIWVQETIIAEYGWRVRFEVTDSDNEKPIMVPAAGPALIKCGAEDQIFRIANVLVRSAQRMESKELAAARLNANLKKFLDAGNFDIKNCQETIRNTLMQEMRISSSPYFINHPVPLFGTSTGTYKFAPDGTLSEASTTVTDETAKTLLGLFPIKEELIERWIPDDKDGGSEKSFRAPAIIITLTLSPQVTKYTLRQDQVADDGALSSHPRPALGEPLKLEHVSARPEKGQRVELISVERSGDETPAKASPKAFKIQGSIIPPEE